MNCRKAVLLAALVAANAEAGLLDDIKATDTKADAAILAIKTPQELTAAKAKWRAAWLRGIGGFPERTPLNAKVGPIVKGEGFTMQNVLFESQPGVLVVGHLFLPDSSAFKPPYPAVLMPMGHSDDGVLCRNYAEHMVIMARAGFAAFAWDPISQGERRQSQARFDYTDNCSTEHTRLGFRGWLLGWNFARFELWDGIRALDYLETRADVDCSKVGICGTSGGGTQSAHLQALDDRIKVAFPNCYVSSFREVFGARGCHDAEQFYFNQLNDGVNHAAMLAMGAMRVSLATGSRWDDYFPHAGAVSTFSVYTNLCCNLQATIDYAFLSWHFHCAGPHGLPKPTRHAQVDWMNYCIRGGDAPKPLTDYWALSKGDHAGTNDPCRALPMPFPKDAAFFSKTHQLRDLKEFKSLYQVLAERAQTLAKSRKRKSREELREIVRRRATIRPLAKLRTISAEELKPFDHPTFKWWYLKGAYGSRRENEAAILATLGKSVVGRDAERIILEAAKHQEPQVLKANGWDCIAAAHAYAAEPQLFSRVEFTNPPSSWTDMVCNPDPRNDSYAIAVWGALEEYDWTDLVPPQLLPGQGEDKLYDGKLSPTCAWRWERKPIEVITYFGEEREIGGVRFWSGRSWISKGILKASFYADDAFVGSCEFRPAHTFKQSYFTWKRMKCRRMKMVIEDAWSMQYGYYMWYMHLATPCMPTLMDTPPYTVHMSGEVPTVEIAELEYFKDEPVDLPKPNADGTIAYPESRLRFDWALQNCAISNVSHCANVEPDTTKPDPLGDSIADRYTVASLADPAAFADRRDSRREFLAGFRALCDEFVYVKHLVIGNSIMHATDDMTDASFLEWKTIPDYIPGSQLIRAKINEDGSVTQQVLVEEKEGIIRDPAVALDASYVVFSKRSSMERDNYHLWKYEFATKKLTQLTFEPTMPRALVPGQKHDFPLICADTEPCILPDGSIIFQSTRVCHSVDCWPLPATNLYRCDPDGKNIRRIGFDQVPTFYPQLLPDGRVSFTRWEYNDRETDCVQQLCCMNADGTRQLGLFANNSEWPGSLLHCRGVPGTDKLVAISSGHHVAQKGKFVELNPTEGDDFDAWTYDPAKAIYGVDTNDIVYTDFPDGAKTVKWTQYDYQCQPSVTNFPGMYYLAGASMDCRPGRVPAKMPKGYQYNVYDVGSQFGPQWAYPFALDDGHYLVSYMPEGCRFYRGAYSSRFGVYAVDKSGRRELLAFDWGNHCMQPVAIKARTGVAARKVKKIDYTQGFGTYYIQNVYYGAAAEGLVPGSVKKIRVIALEYRPVHIGWNWQIGVHTSQGKIGTPISVRNGAYDVKHVFGEADVEADGSCMFKSPARTPVYFQLIDKDGLCLQTMRSWSTLMPGEANSCIGCHEHPNDAAPVKQTIASKKPPQSLKSAIPGRPRHPLLDRLEKEGPLASLENWMGVTRPMRTDPNVIAAKGIPTDNQGDGFGFVKDIQPIFNRLLRDHPNEKILGLDLRDVPAELPETDRKAMRSYSKSYLEFADGGFCTDNINFAHALSAAAFRPPCTFGAIKSKRYWAIAPLLTDAERRTLAMWIDLCIPYCSCYTERHTWDAWHQQRFLYTYDKRIFSCWRELDEIRKSLGLPSVPITGFVPNVTEPRKQRYWSE